MLAATIIAILVVFGLGGGPFGEFMNEYVEDPMKSTIAEEDRRKAALDGLKDLQHTIKSFNRQVSRDIDRLDGLMGDYNSTPEDFDRMFARVLDSRKLDIERLWRKRSAMLGHIEPGEWQSIVDSVTEKAAKNTAADK